MGKLLGIAGSVVALLVVLCGVVYRVAIAEDGIDDNRTDIDKWSATTEQLSTIIQNQEAEKKARDDLNAQLCASGERNRAWCTNNGYDVPEEE